jgi:MFS family permease
MRPLGSLVFGYIGDKKGRKLALTASVALMALPTFLIGALPTYEQIGSWASALLILMRLLQGLSVGVKGFGCRPVVDLCSRAEGQRPKASEEGTRGGWVSGWPSMGI